MQKLRTNNGQDHKFVLQLPIVLHFLNHISAAKITSDYLGDHISSQLPSSPPPSERDPSLSSCCHSKMQVYSRSQSWLLPVFKHDSQEVPQHNHQKSKALCFLRAPHQQHWGVDSNGTSSSCACNSHSEEPASKDVREHQRCQQAPASTFLFKPLLCTSYALSTCLCMAKKKRGGKLCFIFCLCCMWSWGSTCLTGFNGSGKMLLVCSHQCFPKDYTGSFQNTGHLHGNSLGRGTGFLLHSFSLQWTI